MEQLEDMVCPNPLLLWVTLFVAGVSNAQKEPPSNLPDIPEGVFSVQATIEIDAPLEKVWKAVLGFSEYPKWNPFVRSQIVTDEFGIPLEDQTPQEDRRLLITVQTPPLALPVDEKTLSNPFNAQISFENITVIDHNLHRAAWKAIFLPDAVLKTERWQAVSTLEGGKTYYESKLVISAPLGHVVDFLFKDGLQKGFEGQAAGLKAWAERT